MLIKYTSKSTGRPISHRNEWSFGVYMILLRNFVPEWYSRSGTTTGVNSSQCDSRRYGILCLCHVNKYRATRGNRSELAPARKSPRCHVDTPWNTSYCENGRQASQIRGFTKRNLISNHEHKALPTRIRTFLKTHSLLTVFVRAEPCEPLWRVVSKDAVSVSRFSSFAGRKVDSCKRYAVARKSGFILTRPKSVTSKVQGQCLEMTQHSSEKSLKQSRNGAGMAQWWEHLLSTNVARVRFPDSTSYVGWVCCWFSSLLREVFLRVLRFSPLRKNQHF